MIRIKNAREIDKMRASNRIVGDLLEALAPMVKPGVNTLELDVFAEDFIRSRGAAPAFKGYQIPGLDPFPGSICASLNHCIVHGIPSPDVVLREGDILGVDVGTLKDGFYGDGAMTYAVGEISEKARHLMDVTREALERGIAASTVGNRIGDIGYAIGSWIHKHGYHVADKLAGHGVGVELHEEPVVPNDGRPNRGPRLKSGMTIAIEPMVNIGTSRVREIGWEYFVADKTLSAHFEHTILITDHEPEILTKTG